MQSPSYNPAAERYYSLLTIVQLLMVYVGNCSIDRLEAKKCNITFHNDNAWFPRKSRACVVTLDTYDDTEFVPYSEDTVSSVNHI